MSHALTPVDAFTSPVTVPDDGDPKSAASVELPFQALADRVEFLRNRSWEAVAGRRIVTLAPFVASAGWSFNDSSVGPRYGLLQTDVASARRLFFSLPNINARLVALRAYVHGNGSTIGAHGALPATLPVLRLRTFDVDTDTLTSVASATDAPANVAAYETSHSFGITGQNLLLSTPRLNTYLQFEGETGANSVANALMLLALEVELDVA
jgi:hypothetical protein